MEKGKIQITDVFQNLDNKRITNAKEIVEEERDKEILMSKVPKMRDEMKLEKKKVLIMV